MVFRGKMEVGRDTQWENENYGRQQYVFRKNFRRTGYRG